MEQQDVEGIGHDLSLTFVDWRIIMIMVKIVESTCPSVASMYTFIKYCTDGTYN